VSFTCGRFAMSKADTIHLLCLATTDSRANELRIL
jgi:hypothetical protein